MHCSSFDWEQGSITDTASLNSALSTCTKNELTITLGSIEKCYENLVVGK